MNRNRIHYRLAADAKRAGMTLVEILVVVAILLILTSVLSYGVMSAFESAKRSVATLDIERMGTQVVAHQVVAGELPSQADGLSAAMAPGDLHSDPWNNAYVYDNPGPAGHDFDIISHARDGAPGGSGWGEDIRHSD